MTEQTILRPPPGDGGGWVCDVVVPAPSPRHWTRCGAPAVCVVVGDGPKCAEHDPEVQR